MLSDWFDQQIKRKRFTASTGGWGSTGSYTTTTVNAAVNKTRGEERYTADRRSVFADYKMFMASTVDILESDLIEWDGHVLDTVEIKDTLQLGHHKRVLARINQREELST